MADVNNRRGFLKSSGAAVAASMLGSQVMADAGKEPLFKISLAEWSLHRALFGRKMDNLDFAKAAKQDYGIDAVEYVNQFFKDKAKNKEYLNDMKQRAADLEVRSVLIMIDGEGALGDADEKRRTKAVENHYKWVDAAKFLDCHCVRVNAQSEGSPEEQMKLAADGLRRLSEFAGSQGLSVLVENHGGLSSNGKWLASVIQSVGLSNCGTLPDFGNFRVSRQEEYDRYQGVTELMPFAKAVSAKSHDFDSAGNETHTDFRRMMKTVLDAGYHGYVGIEYEGSKLPEPEGIRLTKALLERVRNELA